jgi:hypothetical protein
VDKLTEAETGPAMSGKENVSVKAPGKRELTVWVTLIKKAPPLPFRVKLSARASVAKAAMVANMTAIMKRFIVNLR